MRVLLTGATGFLGRHLLPRLLAAGHEVLAMTRKDRPSDDPRLQWVRGDLGGDLPSIAGPVDALVHLGAETDYEAGEERLFAVNASGAEAVARLALEAGARRIVHVSSLEAGGPRPFHDGLVEEGDYPTRPLHAYGRSKVAGEQLVTEAARAAEVPLVVLRPGNLYGGGEAPFVRHLLGLLEQQGEDALLAEWGNHRFQPLHVDDAALMVQGALERAVTGLFHLTDRATPTLGQLWLDLGRAAREAGRAWTHVVPPQAPMAFNEPIHFRYRGAKAARELMTGLPRPFHQGAHEVIEALDLGPAPDDTPPHHEVAETLLLVTPNLGKPLNRDMAGGLGFVHQNVDRFPPLDLLSWGSTLRAKGWPVRVVDAAVGGFGLEEMISHLQTKDVYALTAEVNLPTFESDLRFLRGLQVNTRTRVFARTNITDAKLVERMLRETRVEAVILGEIDLTIDQVLLGKDLRGTARLEKGKVVNTPEDKIEDLDQLPVPARDLVDCKHYGYSSLRGEGFTTVQTSRGCPYSCGYYCPYPLTQGKTWRARSADHVLTELEDCAAKGLRTILFRDATFTLDKKRARAICEGILARDLDIAWWCETRINCLDESLITLMAQAGCRGINVGLESGDDEILKKSAKAGVNVAMVRRILQLCADAGIATHLLVTVGLPVETRRTLFQTYDLVATLPAASIGVTGITPFPGTPLWDDAGREGWIESQEWARYGGNDTVMHTPHLSADDIRFVGEMIFEHFQLTRERGADDPSVREHQARMRAWVAADPEAQASVSV